MARNILQDAANTLPRMIMGERMSYADLETLAQRSDGTRAILFDWSCASEFVPRDGSPRRGEARGRSWYDRDRSMK